MCSVSILSVHAHSIKVRIICTIQVAILLAVLVFFNINRIFINIINIFIIIIVIIIIIFFANILFIIIINNIIGIIIVIIIIIIFLIITITILLYTSKQPFHVSLQF